MRRVKTVRTAADRKKLELVELETMAEVLTKIPITERTLHRYLNKGIIRAYKLDGKLLFNPEDVATFLKHRAVGGGPSSPLVKEKIVEELSKPKFIEVSWRGSYHVMTEEQAKQFFIHTFNIPPDAWLEEDDECSHDPDPYEQPRPEWMKKGGAKTRSSG